MKMMFFLVCLLIHSVSVTTPTPTGHDCADILAQGGTLSGVYTLNNGIKAFCDMTTDGGGWTVFQRRHNGSLDFYRKWTDYAAGFGTPDAEFWLGNDNLYLLARAKKYKLRVDLTAFNGRSTYAEFSNFTYGSSAVNYTLISIGTYSGTAGDSLGFYIGNQFRTRDQDIEDCAAYRHGAWWYDSFCHTNSNLNGRYYNKPHDGRDIVRWASWHLRSLKFSEMKIKPTNAPTRHDCADILAWGQTASGVYTLDNGIKAYCDMTTDGGGWTVFQRRQDGRLNFYRNWTDYAAGFGTPDAEFWLGNDNLHVLASAKKYKLRVDLTDFNGNRAFAEYNNFTYGSRTDNYKLISLGTYSGNASDSLKYHVGWEFSTHDHNTWNTRCAKWHHGAWWYGNCATSNLNGRYYNTSHSGSTDYTAVAWYYWHQDWQSLKFSEMKIKPTNA